MAKTEDKEMVSVFLSHHGIGAHSVKSINEETGKEQAKFFKSFNVNGQTMNIPCDEQVDIPVEFHDAVKQVIEKQKEETE